MGHPSKTHQVGDRLNNGFATNALVVFPISLSPTFKEYNFHEDVCAMRIKDYIEEKIIFSQFSTQPCRLLRKILVAKPDNCENLFFYIA